MKQREFAQNGCTDSVPNTTAAMTAKAPYSAAAWKPLPALRDRERA